MYYLGILGIITTQKVWNSWELLFKMCCFWVVISWLDDYFVYISHALMYIDSCYYMCLHISTYVCIYLFCMIVWCMATLILHNACFAFLCRIHVYPSISNSLALINFLLLITHLVCETWCLICFPSKLVFKSRV